MQEIWREIVTRAMPDDVLVAPWSAYVVVGVALVVVVVPFLWRFARLAVTIVHELGHAVVGMLLGRRFAGFVVSPDMSGHAITVGKPRGFARAMSTWAGYPAPALVGLALVWVAQGRWAPTVLAVLLVVLVLSLVFARSLSTVLALLGTAVVVGICWWNGVSWSLALAAGVFLLLGAWRHLGALITGGRAQDDPQQLARLTRVPAGLWTFTYVIVSGACTYGAWVLIAPYVLP
jgi:hypothetical protein